MLLLPPSLVVDARVLVRLMLSCLSAQNRMPLPLIRLSLLMLACLLLLAADSFAVLYSTYLDRSNLAFAAFQFKKDIHLSNTVYGLGASECPAVHDHM